MDTFPDKYYPMFVFEDKMSGKCGIGGSENADLARSFYNSRNGHPDELKSNCSHPNSHSKSTCYWANSAAAMLYKKNVSSNEYIPYWINGEKEYHCISEAIYNKNGGITNYGHAEKKLMRAILDDLILSEYKNYRNRKVEHPSHKMYKTANEQQCDLGEEGNIVRNMVKNASKYNDFLRSNGFVVKMWSERNMCEIDRSSEDHCCKKFMYNICPKGSELGYLILMSDEKKLEATWDGIRAKWISSRFASNDARGAADTTLGNGQGTSKRGASPPNEERKKPKFN